MTPRSRIVVTSGAVLTWAVVWLRIGPLPAGMLDLGAAESTQVVDRNGETLYEARSGDGSRAEWLAAADVPPSLVDATIAAEDHRFFRHPGLDPIAIARAALRNLRHRRLGEGGSTITQQVAKLLLARKSGGAARPRTFASKLREAAIALRLEHRLTKREILALYLNLAPYGNQLTGAARASRAYFGHDASLLTPAQAAFLAALPQRPSTYNPYRDETRARRRQEYVIVQMGLTGRLTPDGVRESLRERLALAREPAVFLAPHFVEHVLARLAEARSSFPRAKAGRIQTTLDAELQREVEGIVRAQRHVLDRHGAHNVAVAVLDNASGEWLAWVGNRDYFDAVHGGAIDAAITPRQPGSALKPFTYAVAFEDGATPATVLPDVQSFFPTAGDGVLYSPRNYDGRFRGPLLARHALAGSENVPAVALASRVGVPALLRFLRGAGFTTFTRTGAYYGLGVTLGDAEVRLDELVAAYAAFARGGVAIEPTLVRRDDPSSHARGEPFDSLALSLSKGELAQDVPVEPRAPNSSFDKLRTSGANRLVSPRTAFWITDILSDDEARAYAFGRGGSLEFPFPVAAKTGTSQAYRDNWAIGYTRALTVGVWVGNVDREPLIGSSGVTGAGPIFHAVMLAAMRRVTGVLPASNDSATVAAPEGASPQAICALSGLAPTPWCPTVADEWLPSGAARQSCTWHRTTPRGVVVDWPAEYRAWASAERLLDREVSAVTQDSSPAVAGLKTRPTTELPASALQVVSPPDGAVYSIDPTLRREFQTIALRTTADPKARIEWDVDHVPVGASEAGSRVEWPLAAGRHIVTARDARGRRADSAIVVR